MKKKCVKCEKEKDISRFYDRVKVCKRCKKDYQRVNKQIKKLNIDKKAHITNTISFQDFYDSMKASKRDLAIMYGLRERFFYDAGTLHYRFKKVGINKYIVYNSYGSETHISLYSKPKTISLNERLNKLYKKLIKKPRKRAYEVRVDLSKLVCNLPSTNIAHDWLNDR